MWVLLNYFSIYLYIVYEIHLPFIAVNRCNITCWHKHLLLSTRYETSSDVVFCYVIFSHRIYSQQFLFNQNSFSLYFWWDITFSMEVWRLYLIKERRFWISSLTSCLGLKYLLKTFKSYITFFIWWILDMLENYWKKELGDIRWLVLIYTTNNFFWSWNYFFLRLFII